VVGSLRPKVLIVEDDEATRTLYRGVFLLSGYEVFTAADGVDALNLFDQHRPDAVVLDIGLPRLSGLDVGRELAQRLSDRRVPIVVVTADDSQSFPGSMFAAVLHKPVEPEKIVNVVEHAIARFRGMAPS
jgi:DNA-binding response OmpR family regulator